MAAVAEKTVSPMDTLRFQLEKRKDELRRALPQHISEEKFRRVVQTAAQLNPDLLTVNRQSLWNSCLRAASDGLLPDGREGAIVPFKDNNPKSPTNGQVVAQWMPMTYGLLLRFRNSGQFKSITANVVREGDPFEHWIDEHGEHMRHEPTNDSGKPVKVYAAAMLKNGGTMIKVMTHAEVEKRRAVSRAKDGPMWREWWDEAAMKTVLRNLAKRLPTSSDLDRLMRRDDEPEAFDTVDQRIAVGHQAADVAGALEHFSGEASPPKDSEMPSTLSEPPPQDDDAGESEASSNDETRAHAMGAKAHGAGIARRAVPPEYRTPENSHLAKAWQGGWDSAE
jgi:recombination protein RecT